MIRELIVRAAHRWPRFGDWLWELGLDAAPRRTWAAAEDARKRILHGRSEPPFMASPHHRRYGTYLIFGAFVREASEPRKSRIAENAEGAKGIK